MGWPYQQKPPMGWPLDYDSGLVPDAGFWSIWEGSGNKIFDLSRNGNTGTFAGNVAWTPGDLGPAINSPGAVGDHIVIPDSDSISLTGAMTVIAYVKLDTERDYARILEKGNSFSLMAFSAGDAFSFLTRKAAESYNYCTGTSDPADYLGQWVQVVGVWNGVDTAYIYFNGIEENNDPVTGINFDLTDDLWFFSDPTGAGATEVIDGQLGYVYLYRRALSPSKVALLYREPFCMFKDPAEIALLGGYQAVVAGMAGAMTTNTGYWGW